MPGEAFQFDWSEDWAIIAGERTKSQVAHVKLCYSRALILRAYPQQTHEMLFDAHNHAFRVLDRFVAQTLLEYQEIAVAFAPNECKAASGPDADRGHNL